MEIAFFRYEITQTPDGDYVGILWFEGEDKPQHVSTMSAEDAEFLLSTRPSEEPPYGHIG